MSTHNVSLIGLGAMGSSLASAILKHRSVSSNSSTNLTIYNRTITRPVVPTLVSKGAHLAPSLVHALDVPNHGTDVIVFCLLSYDAVNSLLSNLPTGKDWLRGKTVLNLTNGTPQQARAFAARMKSHYNVAAYLDGAVMATPSMVGGPGSQIFVSGADEVDRRAYEGLKAWLIEANWGEACWFGEQGDVGAAAVQDLANLVTMYGLLEGAIVGMALLKKEGARVGAREKVKKGLVKEDGDGMKAVHQAVLPAIQMYVRPLLEGILPLLDYIAQEWDEGIEEGGPHPLGMQAVALQNIVQACEEEGVEVGGIRGLCERMSAAVEEEGASEKGFTIVARKYLL